MKTKVAPLLGPRFKEATSWWAMSGKAMHAIPPVGTAIWEMSGTEESEGHCLSLRPLYFGEKRSISRAKMGRICDSPIRGLQVDDGSVLSVVPLPLYWDPLKVAPGIGSAEQCTFIALPTTPPNTTPLAGFRQGRVENHCFECTAYR
jgi:hypothetical protein